MNGIMSFANLIISFANYINMFTIDHPFIGVIIIAIIIGLNWKKNYNQAKTFILMQHGFIILDGLFQKGKTRFLTLLAREASKVGHIVLCNYYNKYENIRWGSTKDLINLLTDMWLLGEAQNYNNDEINTMFKSEGKERVKEKLKQVGDIKKKYKNIPYDGFHTEFLLQGDEMQNIFYNREAMSNFSGEKKKLLKLLHQVRHFNTLCTFALTNAAEIDLKFRRISSHYINFNDFMGGLFMKYNVYNFEIDKENNFDIDKAMRLTKVPVIKFNGYMGNKIINKIEKTIKRRIKFRFSELGFYTKFNADPDVDIYKPGYLFEYLDNYYKNNGYKKVLHVN